MPNNPVKEPCFRNPSGIQDSSTRINFKLCYHKSVNTHRHKNHKGLGFQIRLCTGCEVSCLVLFRASHWVQQMTERLFKTWRYKYRKERLHKSKAVKVIKCIMWWHQTTVPQPQPQILSSCEGKESRLVLLFHRGFTMFKENAMIAKPRLFRTSLWCKYKAFWKLP